MTTDCSTNPSLLDATTDILEEQKALPSSNKTPKKRRINKMTRKRKSDTSRAVELMNNLEKWFQEHPREYKRMMQITKKCDPGSEELIRSEHGYLMDETNTPMKPHKKFSSCDSDTSNMSQGSTSLRMLDYFVTNYARRMETSYILQNEETKETSIFVVYVEYKTALDEFHKDLIDPFCRSCQDDGIEHMRDFMSRLRQLNFFKWAFSHKVVDYVIQHADEIEQDHIMNRRKYAQTENAEQEETLLAHSDDEVGNEKTEKDEETKEKEIVIPTKIDVEAEQKIQPPQTQKCDDDSPMIFDFIGSLDPMADMSPQKSNAVYPPYLQSFKSWAASKTAAMQTSNGTTDKASSNKSASDFDSFSLSSSQLLSQRFRKTHFASVITNGNIVLNFGLCFPNDKKDKNDASSSSDAVHSTGSISSMLLMPHAPPSQPPKESEEHLQAKKIQADEAEERVEKPKRKRRRIQNTTNKEKNARAARATEITLADVQTNMAQVVY